MTDRYARWKPAKVVLVVEDDAIHRTHFRELLEDYSRNGAFRIEEVLEAASSDAAFQIVDSIDVDLAILDIDLQGSELNGNEICFELRNRKFKRPFRGQIIMLSDKRYSADDKATGLDIGADDYLARPFSTREMKARIEKQLSAGQASSDPLLRIGPINFFPGRREIERADGKTVRLTVRETDLLHALFKAQGEVVSRDDLLRSIWGIEPKKGVDTHTVETHISRIRSKLNPGAERRQYIIAKDRGYRLEIDPPIRAA